MATTVKVYSWTARNSKQETCIVCAPSKAAAARAAGLKQSQMFNLGETGNRLQIEVATSKPGTIFMAKIDTKIYTEAQNG